MRHMLNRDIRHCSPLQVLFGRLWTLARQPDGMLSAIQSLCVIVCVNDHMI